MARLPSYWKAEDIAWVAGIFEGEGTINLRKGSYGARASIRMNDQDVIERVYTIMGFGRLSCAEQNGKPQYAYTVDAAEHVCAFLAAVWRFLGKRRKARAAEALASCRQVGGRAKLTSTQVCEIRARWPAETQYTLASEYRVSQPMISLITRREAWKRVA